jgi:2-polyprenyl-3-methyl-5-hydroxy-6-metoxy-1,4-benzoquinol methylase
MINSSLFIESMLQRWRFKKVLPFLKGRVLDFGGNNGELRKYVAGEYVLVNYDHSQIGNKTFDTIVALAVIEHISPPEVTSIFETLRMKLNPGGIIFLTTPAARSRHVLELLAFLRLLDKKNIKEHKYYWNRKDIYQLAEKTGLRIKEYRKFQFGYNQLAILEANAGRE